MRLTSELLARGAANSRTLKLNGITAAITPAAPDRSVLNGVIVEDFSKLPDHLDTLAAAYAGAGVRAWTVWVPEHEQSTASVWVARVAAFALVALLLVALVIIVTSIA